MLLDDGEGICRFLVLTNNENLTYDDVFRNQASCDMADHVSADYVILKILGEDD